MELLTVTLTALALSGCSGPSDVTPDAVVTDPAQIARDMCVLNVGLAVHGQFLEVQTPTGDVRADDLLEKVLFDYGPGSVQFMTANAVARDEALKRIAREQGAEAASDAAAATIERGCAGATQAFGRQTWSGAATGTRSPVATPSVTSVAPSRVGTTVPPAESPLPDVISGADCLTVLAYWAPLVARDPSNGALIADRFYGGNGLAVVNEALRELAGNPLVGSDPDTAVADVCEDQGW